MARPIAYKDEAVLQLRSAFFDHLLEGPFEFGEGGCRRHTSNVEHDIPLRPEFGAALPENLAEPALDAISHNRSANRARHGETQARAGSFEVLAGHAKRGKQGTGNADTVVIRNSELGGAQNPARGRKRERTVAGGARRARPERLSRR
jgi:hypothetical protein